MLDNCIFQLVDGFENKVQLNTNQPLQEEENDNQREEVPSIFKIQCRFCVSTFELENLDIHESQCKLAKSDEISLGLVKCQFCEDFFDLNSLNRHEITTHNNSASTQTIENKNVSKKRKNQKRKGALNF